MGANLTLKFNIMKKKEQVVQLLYNSMREVDYAEYVEHCELNGLEPLGVESDDFYDFAGLVHQGEFDDLITNIHYSEVNDYAWIITGVVGTWRGDFDVYPTVERTLEDAISSCLGREMNECKIMKDGNTLFVDVIHHDGRNHFILNALTTKGEDVFHRKGEVSLARKENVVKLPEFLF